MTNSTRTANSTDVQSIHDLVLKIFFFVLPFDLAAEVRSASRVGREVGGSATVGRRRRARPGGYVGASRRSYRHLAPSLLGSFNDANK